MPLTESQIRKLEPTDKRYGASDGGGLRIEVLTNGEKQWRLAYRFGGKQRQKTLGPYPLLKLAEARIMREEVKKALIEGRDPEQSEEEVSASREAKTIWRNLCDDFLIKLENEGRNYRTIQALRGQLAKTYPKLGDRQADTIRPAELLEVCRAEEAIRQFENAQRIRSASSRVCRYAIARDLMERDFAADLRGALVTPKAKGFPAIIEPEDFGHLLRAVWAYPGSFVTLCGLKLTAMTWLRSKELRQALWDEIDWENDTWTVPAERMKKKRKHLVPLSRQAIEVLRDLHGLTGSKGPFMFPNASKAGRPMSENTMLNAMNSLGYKGRHVPHGFRKTASTNLNEQGWNTDWIEKQLSHEDDDKVRRAYNAAEYLDQRREMMQHYSDWLDEVRDTVAAPKAVQPEDEPRAVYSGR